MVIKLARAGRDPVIGYAAAELKRCLSRMDPEAEVCILLFQAYDPAETDVIWLGVCPGIAAGVSDPEFDDGYDIAVENARGAIRATNPRSVLLGAYRLLRELGCAWIRPGSTGEIIPRRSLADMRVSVRETASYRHRAVCIEGAVSADHVLDMIEWLPRVGMNGYFNQFRIPFTFYDRWYRHFDNPLLDEEPMSTTQVCGLRDQSVEEIGKRGLLYHATGHGWTCEPFGIPGMSWDAHEGELTQEQTDVLAQVNGKRGLWHGVALNTNLCYSQAAVRGKMVDSIVEYCRGNTEVDCLHVWLADGSNNHCECEECVKKMPADWYVILLNEIDAALTQAGLKTRIVFLVYVDLLWSPETQRLLNPDRFIIMFAPITRSYSESMADAPCFADEDLPAFERNKLKFPSSVGENLAWLRRWQKDFPCDSFDFDYHFMWDHFRDPGYYQMAQILFRDMQNLHKVGLNGMVSCQNQRVFFPSGLGMHAMAAALWSQDAEFDAVADAYFASAFGADAQAVKSYLSRLSDAFDPPYLRLQRPVKDEAAAARFAQIPAILDEYRALIEKNANDPAHPEAIRISWQHLIPHAELCRLLARALEKLAGGDTETAKLLCGDVCACARRHEKSLAAVFDVHEFQRVISGIFENAGK